MDLQKLGLQQALRNDPGLRALFGLEERLESLVPDEAQKERNRQALLLLGSFGAGFAPGGGLADAAGLLPGVPGIVENFQTGRIFDAGAQALGVVGDALYLPPVAGAVIGPTVGSLLKAPRAGVRARGLAEVLSQGAKARKGKLRLFEDVPERPYRQERDLDVFVPPGGASARVKDLISNPDVREKMKAEILKGISLGAENWSNTEPLRQGYIKLLGEDLGNKRYEQLINFIGTTTSKSKIGENLRNASMFAFLDNSPTGFPKKFKKLDPPYGHVLQQQHQAMARDVVDHGWDSVRYPKSSRFVENLLGNPLVVAVDSRAFRLPAMLSGDPRFLKKKYRDKFELKEITMEEAQNNASYWIGSPRKGEYAEMEKYYRSLAEELGVTPRTAQNAAWLVMGHSDKDLMSLMEVIENRIKKTADKIRLG